VNSVSADWLPDGFGVSDRRVERLLIGGTNSDNQSAEMERLGDRTWPTTCSCEHLQISCAQPSPLLSNSYCDASSEFLWCEWCLVVLASTVEQFRPKLLAVAIVARIKS